tara:strand:- start:236309 stop:237268 length:960 start_codon:yes stop_codon:yes gene_type:complete
MSVETSHDLGTGITCIDASYVRPGLACFYVLENDGQCAIIETGTAHSVTNLLQVLQEKGLAYEQVRYVIPTHVHLDHAGGAGAMMALFPNAELLIHPRGARHMVSPQRLVESSIAVYGETLFNELYGEITPVEEARVRTVEDDEVVKLNSRELVFRHTRGHADHHFCLWDALSEGWFTGDMFGISYPWFRFDAGALVIPATTPTQFDPDAYIASLELLASYQPQRMYLTHYGQLEYSSAHLTALVRQVRRYGELAQQHSDEAGLNKALSAYSLGLLRAFAPQANDDTLLPMLSLDMDLNTQGLLVWRQRMEHSAGNNRI